MRCEECGLILDGVTEDQIIKSSRFARIIAYCPEHAEQVLGIPA